MSKMHEFVCCFFVCFVVFVCFLYMHKKLVHPEALSTGKFVNFLLRTSRQAGAFMSTTSGAREEKKRNQVKCF